MYTRYGGSRVVLLRAVTLLESVKLAAMPRLELSDLIEMPRFNCLQLLGKLEQKHKHQPHFSAQ